VIHEITRTAFEEYRGKVDPPPSAMGETLEEVEASFATDEIILAFLDGEPAGSIRLSFKDDHIYCSRVAVHPTKQRHGVAGAMLTHIAEIAKAGGYPEVRLATREVMESNLRLYERNGFQVTAKYVHPKGGGIVVDLVKIIR
jgi:ribosomal protein S18 acetylase RimI-like enzyme